VTPRLRNLALAGGYPSRTGDRSEPTAATQDHSCRDERAVQADGHGFGREYSKGKTRDRCFFDRSGLP